MSIGRPDFTRGISIQAVEIAALPIDIKAQTLGTVAVTIQSSATLNVNIASQTSALNVNIGSISAGVTFNVAQSGTWTVNAVQSGTWTVNIGSAPTLNINISSISAGVTFNVAQSGTWTVNIGTAPTLNINISSISTGVTFNVAQSGTWTVNAVQSGTWTVNVGSTPTLNVNISSISAGVTFNVAQSGTWTVNIGSAPTLNVNIQSSTTLNVNISASSATLNINISAQSTSVKLVPDWGAINAQDISGIGIATGANNTWTTLISYTVPSGKTLLIYDWAIMLTGATGNLVGELFNNTAGTALAVGGGVQGFAVTFSTPKRIPGGQTVTLSGAQLTGSTQSMTGYIGGVLI